MNTIPQHGQEETPHPTAPLDPPPPDPLTVDAAGAATLLGLARSTFLKLHSAGRVPAPIRLGRRVLWVRKELEAWVNAGAPSRARWKWDPDSH